MKRKVGQGFTTTRFSLCGSLRRAEEVSSHFICTWFIVVGTRLSKYRQLPMGVCIFVNYSKLERGGEIFNQSTLISIIIVVFYRKNCDTVFQVWPNNLCWYWEVIFWNEKCIVWQETHYDSRKPKKISGCHV